MISDTVNRFCFEPQSLPVGWFSVEQKYCENCMRAFVRKACACKLNALLRGEQIDFAEFRCSCSKYCAGCIGRLLLPLDLQDYKDILPREAEMSHAHHLPRYDDTLMPKKRPMKPRRCKESREEIERYIASLETRQ